MGNQCCQQGRPLQGQTKSSKFQYVFQQDKEQTANPILRTSNFVVNTPPNQFSERQKCQQPRTNLIIKQSLDQISGKNFADPMQSEGIKVQQYYMFKRSGNIYQGPWKNNAPHGVGIMYFQKGSVYYGNFIQGVPFGRGRLIMTSGAYYEGQIKYGKANGEGEFRDNSYRYKGFFRDDLKHGEGEEKQEGYNFKGLFQNGDKVRGTYQYEGCVYKGEFENDEFNGSGQLINEDGSTYKGQFRNGRFHGYGEFKWKDGSQYRGYYLNGLRQGDGEFFNSKNSGLSKGIWRQGILDGEGQYKDYRGNITKCIWDKGKMTGIKSK